MSNFLPINHVFEAGESARFLVPGCVGVSVVDAEFAIDIDFLSESYQLQGRAQGAIVGMSGGCGGTFHWLEITSATAQTVSIFAYGGTFSVSKTAGQVTVNGTVAIDGKVQIPPDYESVFAEEVFRWSNSTAGASGKYSFLQIYNPLDSGVMAVVADVQIGTNLTSGTQLWVKEGRVFTVAELLVSSAISGGADGKCLTAAGIDDDSLVGDTVVGLFVRTEQDVDGGLFALPPGHSLMVRSSAVNSVLRVSANVYEVAL